jgi:hypothetical protein
MFHKASMVVIMIALCVGVVGLAGEDTKAAAASGKVPKGAKVFIAPIGDGFDSYLKGAFADKKVPVEIVGSRDLAEFEITGTSDSQKASTAKKVIMGNWHSREEASIRLSNIKSSVVIWSYAVHKEASAHGKKSTAEACAKHLKDEAIDK